MYVEDYYILKVHGIAPNVRDGFSMKWEMTVQCGVDSKIKALPGTSFQQQVGKRKGLLIKVCLKANCQWIIQ